VKSATAQHRRSFWLKQLHQWHWISAALSLIGMLLFAITGITLNHAGQIEAEPQVVSRKATLPPDLLAVLAKGPEEGKRPLPVKLEPFLDEAVGADVAGREGEWSADEVYVALARPGGDAWVSIDRETGAIGPVTQSFDITGKRRIAAEAFYARPVGAGDVAFFGRAETDDGGKTTDRYLAGARYRFAF